MVWFLHSVESVSGHWTCRRGQHLLDAQGNEHARVDDAVSHLREVAQELEGVFQFVLHFADGTVRTMDPDV